MLPSVLKTSPVIVFDLCFSFSWNAEDLSISQSDEKDGSLELNVAVRDTLCTCRTIELFSSSGYLKSIRGNVVQVKTSIIHLMHSIFELFFSSTN